MVNRNNIEEFIQNRDQHEDYYVLMEEYDDTEIYKEIIHFMYLAFPEWTSNRGIGSWAAEFVLTGVRNLEGLYKDGKITSSDRLKDIYLTLVDNYRDSKIRFELSQTTLIVDVFERECEDELESIKDLENEPYNLAWNKLYVDFEKEYLTHTTYDFISKQEIIVS